jgi:class 3 adenylate cyclase
MLGPLVAETLAFVGRDGIFAVFDGPTRAVRCGLELIPTLATRGLSIRAGLHTAECERRGPGPISWLRLIFESVGPRHLKGIAEPVDVYRVQAD